MNSTNSTLTKELVNELFTYENGALFWKICPAKNVPAGAKAGYVQGNKYLGVKNVSWRKATKKWDVRVQKANVSYYVGSYKTLEEAAQARLTLHQEFVRHT